MTTSPSDFIGGIRLVPDTDEPGLNAAAKNGVVLAELFRWWGLVRYDGEPTSYALAQYQRDLDDMAQTIQAREAAGLPVEQVTLDRQRLWDHMWHLWQEERPTVFSKVTSLGEYEAFCLAEDIIPPPTHRIDYDAIKAAVDIVDYIGAHTVLRQRGINWTGKCPLPDHEDSTPSFTVYPKTRSWYCFGCNRGGDVIDYAKLKGLDVPH